MCYIVGEGDMFMCCYGMIDFQKLSMPMFWVPIFNLNFLDGSQEPRRCSRTDTSLPSSSRQTNTNSTNVALVPPVNLSAEHKKKFQEHVEKKLIRSHCIMDWEILGEYGLKQAVQGLIGNGP